MNCNQQKHRVTRLRMQCQMLLVNSETVWDKRFLKFTSTGLNEFTGLTFLSLSTTSRLYLGGSK